MSKSNCMIILAVLILPLICACGGDDDELGVELVDTTINLTADNLTSSGYFDGLLYYMITSNSQQEVTINKASNKSITVEIPAYVKIEGIIYKCTSINRDAFRRIGTLKDVTIPHTVTFIGSKAFYGCMGLSTIHCKCKTPPKTNIAGFGSFGGITLYVPKGSLDAYKSTGEWQTFDTIIEE